MSVNHAPKWETNTQYHPETQPKTVVKKVKRTRWITKGEKVIYAFAGVLMLAFAVYMVSFSSSTDTLNRELQQIEQSVNQQKIANEGLSFEKEELSRPERIINIAEENGLKIQNTEVKQVQSFNN
ncbi:MULTISPECIES: cell division protein FtsL [Oceanobacillus]|uniref:Cell division protein FtsL n=1 Tax=Oceanobacillus kimchii TaxID=746691 RepID=A0ABQ5THF6_9BACI|nr:MULTISPECIES: cell division protein FtsL [Oceanobacillus]MBT2598804.1 cell division protein FtsL [Oceanobacillus sp. ISL-74]MBT2651723.1 cell division protein FtsL [Oceanobacillus sp. ISL-73]MCT1576372.1 cell division protein FtsL [Oceanobacillus kimchii]MCT2136008.1 cell division protein FtsL [Oceanobacillus kimchii]OEH54570.1 cell division protein FtsL [Oceanobacillus sp. E9]